MSQDLTSETQLYEFVQIFFAELYSLFHLLRGDIAEYQKLALSGNLPPGLQGATDGLFVGPVDDAGGLLLHLHGDGVAGGGVNLNFPVKSHSAFCSL